MEHQTQTAWGRKMVDKLESKLLGDGQVDFAAACRALAVPEDRIAKATALRFTAEGTEGRLRVGAGDMVFDTHRHAFGQLLSRGTDGGQTHGLPAFGRYLQDAGEPWAGDLLAHNLTTLYANDTSKYLLRSVGTELRGFLSDKYRRLDSRPIIEQIVKDCAELGAVPYRGSVCSETRISLKAVLPVVFEPIPREALVFGLAFENSDYGNGKLSVRFFAERLFCLNGMVSDQGISQVHLGKRLSEDVAWSEQTYRLDTAAMASAVHDATRSFFEPKRIEAHCSAIKVAFEEGTGDPKALRVRLQKALGKGTAEEVIEAFNGPDVELLPAGNNTWRLSNALSYVAGQREDADEAMALQLEAGRLVPGFGAALAA